MPSVQVGRHPYQSPVAAGEPDRDEVKKATAHAMRTGESFNDSLKAVRAK